MPMLVPPSSSLVADKNGGGTSRGSPMISGKDVVGQVRYWAGLGCGGSVAVQRDAVRCDHEGAKS